MFYFSYFHPIFNKSYSILFFSFLCFGLLHANESEGKDLSGCASSLNMEINETERALKRSYKWDLAACVIFRDEAPYLREWIEFHKMVGFKHFYFFNNLSQDNYLDILRPYIQSGEVELIEWPYESANVEEWDKIQCAAYNRALLLARGKVKWLAILDTDEFLFSPANKDLGAFLSNYDHKQIGGVCVNWVMFGTSRVKRIPGDKLMIETLILSAGAPHHCFKTIVRPERAIKCPNPHECSYKKGYSHVNPDLQPVVQPSFFSLDKLRINHYWSRDEHYFYTQKIPRRQKWLPLDVAGYEQWVERMNSVPDYSILHLVPALRKKMGMK